MTRSSFLKSFFRGGRGKIGFDSHSPDVAKKTDSTRYAVPALRFKTCRLLSGNVRNRELTIIQRRILRRLRNKKRSIKRKIYPRKNLNSYIHHKLHESCPFFMGIYPSQRCTEEQSELHISLFHSIQKQDRTLFRFVSIFVKLFLKQGSR